MDNPQLRTSPHTCSCLMLPRLFISWVVLSWYIKIKNTFPKAIGTKDVLAWCNAWVHQRNLVTLEVRTKICQWNIFSVVIQDNITCHFTELHGFCDASEWVYATVLYLHMTCSDGKIQVALVMSKRTVPPMKRLTIPRWNCVGLIYYPTLFIMLDMFLTWFCPRCMLGWRALASCWWLKISWADWLQQNHPSPTRTPKKFVFMHR